MSFKNFSLFLTLHSICFSTGLQGQVIQRGVAPMEAFQALMGSSGGRITDGGFGYSDVTLNIGKPGFQISQTGIPFDSIRYDRIFLPQMEFYANAGASQQYYTEKNGAPPWHRKLWAPTKLDRGNILTYAPSELLEDTKYKGFLDPYMRRHAVILKQDAKPFGVSPTPERSWVPFRKPAYPDGSCSILLPENFSRNGASPIGSPTSNSHLSSDPKRIRGGSGFVNGVKATGTDIFASVLLTKAGVNNEPASIVLGDFLRSVATRTSMSPGAMLGSMAVMEIAKEPESTLTYQLLHGTKGDAAAGKYIEDKLNRALGCVVDVVRDKLSSPEQVFDTVPITVTSEAPIFSQPFGPNTPPVFNPRTVLNIR